MVVRDRGGRARVRVTVDAPSTEYWMVARVAVSDGLRSVRYIWKSGCVVPSPKSQLVDGGTAAASCAPSIGTGICENAPAGWVMYIGRSTATGTSDVIEAPTPVNVPFTPPWVGSNTTTVSRRPAATSRTTLSFGL